MSRLNTKLDALKAENRKAFVAYIMAGDPDLPRSFDLLCGLPKAGVDIIELGVPFTDPMADGPIIQLSGQRSLEAGTTVEKVLQIVQRFRAQDQATPLVLMGYFNPILSYGVDKFLAGCRTVGVDGLIIVDLPPEEDAELCLPAQQVGISFIRLTTPTTNDRRLRQVLQNATGFVYYVSITGITGAARAQCEVVQPEVARIKQQSNLPVIVGFGVKSAENVGEIASVCDGVVVGSAIVEKIAAGMTTTEVLDFVSELAASAHSVES